jgi:hypothetical protein
MEKLHKNANLTNFKKLNYPYTIKIALIKRNQTEQYHFKKISSAKTTYQNNSVISLPNFTARWRSIRKNFIQSKQATGRNNPKYNSKMKLQHTPIVEKMGNANQSSQSHYYSHFNFKTKQTRPSGAVRTAKRTKEALRQIFKAIITI